MESDAVEELQVKSCDVYATGIARLPFDILDRLLLPLDFIKLCFMKNACPSLGKYFSRREFVTSHNDMGGKQAWNFTYFFRQQKHEILAMSKGKQPQTIELKGVGRKPLELLYVWRSYFVLGYETRKIGEGGLILYNLWTEDPIKFERPCYGEEKERMYLEDKPGATKMIDHPDDDLGWILTYFHPVYRNTRDLKMLFATKASQDSRYSQANHSFTLPVDDITPDDTEHELWRIMLREKEVVVMSMRGAQPVCKVRSRVDALGGDISNRFARLGPTKTEEGHSRVYTLCDSNNGYLAVVVLQKRIQEKGMHRMERVWLYKVAPDLEGGYCFVSAVPQGFLPGGFNTYKKFCLRSMDQVIVFSLNAHVQGNKKDLWRARVIWYDPDKDKWDKEYLETNDKEGVCGYTLRGMPVIRL